jgi:hypothetical protein
VLRRQGKVMDVMLATPESLLLLTDCVSAVSM